MVMRRDYTYWGLDELCLEPCCALKFYPEMQNCMMQTELDTEEKIKEEEMLALETFGDSKLATIRSELWDFLEKPWTSKPAKIFAFISLSILFISTVTFIISTVEEYSDEFEETKKKSRLESNPTQLQVVCIHVDTFTFIFFTLEYVFRFICCPRKWIFFKETMNMIDLVTLLPFYFGIVLEELQDYQTIGKAGKMLRLMKIMRIFRVYKLFRHFAGLRSLFYTLKQAYKELGLLFHIVGVFGQINDPFFIQLLDVPGVAVLCFASIVYMCEAELADQDLTSADQNTTWTFLDSFLWSLMTITTVGQENNPSVRNASLGLGYHFHMLKQQPYLDHIWKVVCRSLCLGWRLPPDSTSAHCGQQLRGILQEQTLAKRGGAQEERQDAATRRGKEKVLSVKKSPGDWSRGRECAKAQVNVDDHCNAIDVMLKQVQVPERGDADEHDEVLSNPK